jgi:hypothetical protein
VLAVGLTLGGCGNSGGSMTCGQFNKASDGRQTSAIKAMLKERGGDTSDEAVSVALGSARMFCLITDSDDPISGIYG